MKTKIIFFFERFAPAALFVTGYLAARDGQMGVAMGSVAVAAVVYI